MADVVVIGRPLTEDTRQARADGRAAIDTLRAVFTLIGVVQRVVAHLGELDDGAVH
jgi:hypothetical protein